MPDTTSQHHRPPRVLITGASIAGPALAWGLTRIGYDVTLLERSPRQRETGQNIDIRGLGREILRRMGIEDEVRRNLTGERGTHYVDDAGHAYATLPREEGRDGPTAELEILRGTFAGMLVDLVDNAVDLRYGDFVTAARQDADGVDVEFDSGARDRFDLLLVAEGRSSRTRRLLFADQTRYRDFGATITYGTIERRPGDTDWWDWYTAAGGRVASLRPDNVGSMRATLSFASDPMGYQDLPVESQLTVLRERFAGAGWQTRRILDGFTARPEEFYVQRVEQVIMSTWSSGRVAVLGDAAWGSGPTGMGTTLSLVGAHVLAGELAETYAANGNHPGRAFTRYESMLRRYVDSAQGLPFGGARLLHPSTRAGVTAIQALHRLTATRPLRRLLQNSSFTSARHVPDLPDYPCLRG
ncbi:FAD-dependent monooxygenase [Actinoplanes philippinensis]|uniref:FAD-dependent monooxygenase n=1 Tax=Actinoplanes philippinensis TaxID=35752 RepID=UPI0033C1A6FE